MVPQCPFVAAYIAKHPEWRDLLAGLFRREFLAILALLRLAGPHLGIEAACAQQLGVRAPARRHGPASSTTISIGMDHGRQPVGDDDRGAAARDRLAASPGSPASVRLSSALVASSRIRIGGFLSRVRAMATRCFSPPDSLRPRSPTRVS